MEYNLQYVQPSAKNSVYITSKIKNVPVIRWMKVDSQSTLVPYCHDLQASKLNQRDMRVSCKKCDLIGFYKFKCINAGQNCGHIQYTIPNLR